MLINIDRSLEKFYAHIHTNIHIHPYMHISAGISRTFCLFAHRNVLYICMLWAGICCIWNQKWSTIYRKLYGCVCVFVLGKFLIGNIILWKVLYFYRNVSINFLLENVVFFFLLIILESTNIDCQIDNCGHILRNAFCDQKTLFIKSQILTRK